MKKPVLFITFIILTVVVLSLVQIIVSNRLTTTGAILSKLEEDINLYEKENSLLEEKLLSAQSLSKISLLAQEKGFIKDDSHLSLTTPLPIVRLRENQKQF